MKITRNQVEKKREASSYIYIYIYTEKNLIYHFLRHSQFGGKSPQGKQNKSLKNIHKHEKLPIPYTWAGGVGACGGGTMCMELVRFGAFPVEIF